MNTYYQIGQRIWYIECYSYSLPGNRAVAYYRPFRGKICEVNIHRIGKHNSVKYGIEFDSKNHNKKGYPQQNEHVFVNKKNALDYARLLNELVDSYDKDDSQMTMASEIVERLNVARKLEPVEPNVY